MMVGPYDGISALMTRDNIRISLSLCLCLSVSLSLSLPLCPSLSFPFKDM